MIRLKEECIKKIERKADKNRINRHDLKKKRKKRMNRL
jgi:hypothetical protein